jgi:glyoxylase-like metal-dependent hydrolase (beta-lactamase superfamily II)
MDRLTFGSITVDALRDGELRFPLERMFPVWTPACSAASEGGRRRAALISADDVRHPDSGEGRLVDTGIGPDISPLARFGFTGEAGLLPGALETPRSWPTVDRRGPHLHTDHIGWNTVDSNGSMTPLFPNARYLVNRTEWEHRLTVAGSKGVARCLDPVEASGQLTRVDDGYEVAPGVSLVATPGHTPGHVSVLVMGAAGEGGIITGDAMHHPAEIENPVLSPPFDSDPVQSAASRRMLVQRAEEEGLVVMGGHFPAPGAGGVVRVGEARAWRWVGAGQSVWCGPHSSLGAGP